MMLSKKVLREFKKNKGVRIGQAAVVSRKVHTIYPDRPEIVNIITNADAGKVFYGRLGEGEIIHIDLFHEVSTLDVKQTATYLAEHLKKSQYSYLTEYIDIQTGAGGGKLDGSLIYGRSESLKKDHLNHVHIAALISDDELDSIFFIIKKLEEVLQEQKIELRKIEKIRHQLGDSPMDISPYVTDSDSNLKGEGHQGKDYKLYDEAVKITNYFGSIKAIEEVLEVLKSSNGFSDISEAKKKNSDFDDIVKYLEKNRFLHKKNKQYKLTKDGKKLYKILRLNRRELEGILKRSIKNIPRLKDNKSLGIYSSSRGKAHAEIGTSISEPFKQHEGFGELDVNQTVKNALVRCYLKPQKFNISKEDVFFLSRIPKLQQDVCLLIDASASMAGYRLRNAKYLAKHLILNSRRRVSVLAFQEKQVLTYVSFTKNFDLLEDGINKITSTGLTPLALALDKGLSYTNTKSLKNPLIMLVTDGIPTVALESSDPIKDAINVANKIARKKVSFCCIGLQPNRDCLIKITEAAKGKLFVVEELNRELLVEVARKTNQLL